MKYFAELVEQDIPDGENGVSARFEISGDNEIEASSILNIVIGWYPLKIFKKYIHICGNTSDGENTSCILREIQ